MDNFDAVLRRVDAATQRGMEQGVREALDEFGAATQDVVPYDQGTLSASMSKRVTGRGPIVDGHLAYDTVYAARQHEETTWRHDPGRTAKYVSGPLASDGQRYAEWIAQRAADAIGE